MFYLTPYYSSNIENIFFKILFDTKIFVVKSKTYQLYSLFDF